MIGLRALPDPFWISDFRLQISLQNLNLPCTCKQCLDTGFEEERTAPPRRTAPSTTLSRL